MADIRRPDISLYAHADCGEIDLERLGRFAREVMPLCLSCPGGEEAVLPSLEEIEVSLVDDGTIAEVHGQFMEDPTPTDVITFQHGEILVSVETAKREGQEHGNSPERETLLYIIHGLLHLNGHTDLREPDRTAMHREQEEILARVLPSVPAASCQNTTNR